MSLTPEHRVVELDGEMVAYVAEVAETLTALLSRELRDGARASVRRIEFAVAGRPSALALSADEHALHLQVQT